MRFYSTKNKSHFYSLEEAVIKGLPDDNGLFVPETIPVLDKSFWQNISQVSFQEIAFEISKAILKDDVPKTVLHDIVFNAINFDAPLVQLDEETFVLELFHGPTLAFKDFGARFMAQLLRYLIRGSNKKLTIDRKSVV